MKIFSLLIILFFCSKTYAGALMYIATTSTMYKPFYVQSTDCYTVLTKLIEIDTKYNGPEAFAGCSSNPLVVGSSIGGSEAGSKQSWLVTSIVSDNSNSSSFPSTLENYILGGTGDFKNLPIQDVLVYLLLFSAFSFGGYIGLRVAG